MIEITGIIHVGANIGQEREQYGNLPVLWIEPIPEVYEQLCANLMNHPSQIAYQYLITNEDGCYLPFHVASNHGASSSLYEMQFHRLIWPHITMERMVMLKTLTLETFINLHVPDPPTFNKLVIDVQGAEMLVLLGLGTYRRHFRVIEVETADFPAYRGAANLWDVEDYMRMYQYREVERRTPTIKRYGTYYELVYERLD